MWWAKFYKCREDNKLTAGDVEFKVYSRFEIDTEGLKFSVLIIEDYGEPLQIDDFAKLSNGIKTEIKEYIHHVQWHYH